MEHLDVGGVTRVAVDPDRTPTYPDDKYPAIIADQRVMFCDPRTLAAAELTQVTSVADATAYEMAWLTGHGKSRKPDPEQRELIPYISKSRWCADCPNCNGGIACWDENPHGCCLECGYVYKIAWQPPKMRAEAIRILAARPYAHRDWHAHKGESVERLKTENLVIWGIGTTRADGMTVAEGVIPKDCISPVDYLDRLRAEDARRHGI